MTGTFAVGILRTLAAEGLGPAALLDSLNRRMVELKQEGFITCLCVLVSPNGEEIAANAGHLSPYRAGKEISFDSGLPVGITPDAMYTEHKFSLAPGETLTLLSDGVVEARDPKGELLGFERVAALTGKSAAEIAEAAQRWGQEDDITVLTVARLTQGLGGWPKCRAK
jgi:serine phosphatase RsbU (regulator of sigma subunit)